MTVINPVNELFADAVNYLNYGVFKNQERYGDVVASKLRNMTIEIFV